MSDYIVAPTTEGHKVIDLTGQRFGRLRVLGQSIYRDKRKLVLWVCVCDCGAIKVVNSNKLRTGHVLSCGCLFREGANGRTHGMTSSRLYHNNTRRNRRLTFRGETLTVARWARRMGLKPNTLRARITEYGWSAERALTTP